MSAEEKCIGIVIEHLKETLLKYLDPKLFLQKFISDGKLNDGQIKLREEREELVEMLLNWILESDESQELVRYFTSSLKELSKESTSQLFVSANIKDENGAEVPVYEYLPDLIRMIDGSLIKELGRNDLNYILKKMIDCKLIMEHSLASCNKATTESEFCLEIFRSVKTRKPDWPFKFISLIQSIKPSALTMYNQSKSLGSSETEGHNVSSCIDLTLSDRGSCNLSTCDTLNEANSHEPILPTPIVIPTLASSKIVDEYATLQCIKVPHLSYQEATYEVKKISGPASLAPSDVSDLSEISPDFLESMTRTKALREITTLERQEPAFNELLKKKVVDEKLLKVVEKKKDSNGQSRDDSDVDHSDCEDGSDSPQREVKRFRKTDEAPPLNLRNYQLELAEKAIQGFNTVICAPTGSGKTRVATHIILEHLKQNKNKTIAFLARTIPLTVQQYKVLGKSLPPKYSVTYITGQNQGSLELRAFVKSHPVVVLTPMILVNNLREKSVRMRHFSLLIFDECHHTRKDEPYNLLMMMYLKAKFKGNEKTRNSLPQIVGLSASLGIDRAKNVNEAANNILKICGNLDAPYLSTIQNPENLMELRRLVPVPQEIDFQLKERDGNDALDKVVKVMAKLEDCAMHSAKELNDPGILKLIQKMPRNKKSQEYGQWAVDLKSSAKAVPIDNISYETKEPVRNLIIIADYLWNYNVALETHDLVELNDVIGYLKKRFEKYSNKECRTDKEDTFYCFFEDLVELVKNRHDEDNENLGVLAQILDENIVQKGKDSRGIIFVRTRALAEALSSWLNRCGIQELEDLNASVFTGTNAKEEEGGMSQAQQEDIIKDFRAGKIKVLVATSVAEEGLDIPDCNLVIKYNHVGNEITTVQTKGRSRKRGGVAYLLGMDNILRKEYVNREKEKLMKKAFTKIDKMTLEVRKEEIENYQKQIMQDVEIEEALAAKKRKLYKDNDFTMVCSLCRKVAVKKENIRSIFDKFRVSIDRELLNEEYIKCIPKRSQYIDDMELLGPVFCRGQPRPGKRCGHKLGTMIKFCGVHYFAMGIKNFGFYKNNQEKLEYYKMWKAAPYVVENLTMDDIRKYSDIHPDDITTADIDDDESSDDDGNMPVTIKKINNSENDSGLVTDDSYTTYSDDTLADEKNSVTRDDILQALPVKGSGTDSLLRKADSELGKAPSLSSKMLDEVKLFEEESVQSVQCSESVSEDSF
ncbi:Antiviral innate immune response receptor RIG-I [Bulinus truncatus]|nr:Antiviral innate immune response receptor RIG-I [Bulinus truncatus]